MIFARLNQISHNFIYTRPHIHQTPIKRVYSEFFFFSKIEQNKNIHSTTKIELMSSQKCITFHTLQIQLAQCLFLISHLWYGIPSPFDIVPQCALSSSSSTFSVILVHESEKYRQYLCFFYAIYICICTYPNVLFILIVFAFIVIIAVAVAVVFLSVFFCLFVFCQC